MSMLEKAISIAVKAHSGKKDKAGAPYLLHPLRVMFRMETEDEMIAAVLHDVVEDSDWTLEDLRGEGFSETVVEAVDSLTRREAEGETYEAFVERAGLHPVGLKVKMGDLRDNMNLSRIANPGERDWERLSKYRLALERLAEMEKIQHEVMAAVFTDRSGKKPAAVVELAPMAMAHTFVRAEAGAAGALILSGFGPIRTRPVSPGDYMAVRKIIDAADPAALYNFDPDLAPFFCAECGCVYSMEEWTVRGGGLKAKCPEGHGRPRKH